MFEVDTKASKHGRGAMLSHWHRGKLRPVKFSSRSFNPTESRWPTTHQELYAVKWALEQNRPYLLGHPIKVITDHANLKFFTSISPQQPKIARLAISMAEFDFTLEHRPEKEHVVPDTLSRAPLPKPPLSVITWCMIKIFMGRRGGGWGGGSSERCLKWGGGSGGH